MTLNFQDLGLYLYSDFQDLAAYEGNGAIAISEASSPMKRRWIISQVQFDE